MEEGFLVSKYAYNKPVIKTINLKLTGSWKALQYQHADRYERGSWISTTIMIESIVGIMLGPYTLTFQCHKPKIDSFHKIHDDAM